MTEETIVLPMEKIAPEHHNPRNLIIFSLPKVGKTPCAAGLDDSLILDLESGSDFVSARKLKATSIADIQAIGKKIKESGYPYKYIVIDTITALEELCIDYAETLYSKSPMGQGWFDEGGGKEKYGSILNMAKGSGYYWLRQAFEKVVNYIKTWAPNIIQMGHVKDAEIEKTGSEFSALSLDLTGKIKRIASSKSDAIGYMYRKGNQNILSFVTSDKVLCGARSPHLAGKQIVLSEQNDDGTLVFHWDRIYVEK